MVVLGMRKDTTLLFFLFFFFLFTFFSSEIVMAAPESDSKKVVVLIIDNVNYDDLILYGGDNIKHLLSEGSLGLMNTNTGGTYRDTNAYATIGAGTKSVSTVLGECSGGYDDIHNAYLIREIYNRNTGFHMSQQNIVNIDISSIIKNNQNLDHPVRIGSLGSILNENGIKTAVIGNESDDMANIKVRANLITMNDRGVTNFGKVNSSLLVKDITAPFGIRTDYEALYDTYAQLKDKAGFIVIQSGDTHRLNKYVGYSDSMINEIKNKIFRNVDEFLGKILNDVDENTLLLVITPFPSSEDTVLGKKLTPIIAYKKNHPSGLITTSTTKRDGIIINTDISVEILNYFGLQKDTHMVGHEFIYKKHDNPLSAIQKIEDISVFNYTARSTVIKTFIGYVIAVLLASVIITLYFKKYMPYLRPFIASIMITPIVILLIPLLNPWDTVSFSIYCIGSTALFSFVLVTLLKDDIKLFAFIFIFSAAVIIIDTLLGNTLMKVSILGYDPIIGARFYGIGNEYMGFLLGSTAIGTTALLEIFKERQKKLKYLCVALYVCVLFTLAMPFLGTNVGGTIAGLVCFASLSILLFKGRISIKDLKYIVILLFVFLLLLFLYDGSRPQQLRSHIGQTTSTIKSSSLFSLLPIFKRKLSTNLKLIKYSNWTLVLITITTVLGILFRWPVGIFREIFCQYKYMYYGFLSGILGVMTAFVFNDSGVVAAATFMIPIGMSLILLNIEKIYQRGLPNKV